MTADNSDDNEAVRPEVAITYVEMELQSLESQVKALKAGYAKISTKIDTVETIIRSTAENLKALRHECDVVLLSEWGSCREILKTQKKLLVTLRSDREKSLEAQQEYGSRLKVQAAKAKAYRDQIANMGKVLEFKTP